MSTNSSIAVEREDGCVIGIYCHFDGYPSHVGAILKKFYCDYDAAMELIEGGDISSLDEKCGDAMYYALRGNWEAGLYGLRIPAKNEPWERVRPQECVNYFDFKIDNNQEYNYLFKNGTWLVRKGTDRTWTKF